MARKGSDPAITIDDPMLEPVPPPPPKRTLSSWQEALKIVRTRSPDLTAAYAQIQVARGRARQALAPALPVVTSGSRLTHHLVQGFGFNFNTLQPGPIPEPRSTFITDLTVRVPLLSARTWYDYGTAKKEIERARLQADDVERLVIGGLAESIVAVVTSERLSEVTRVNLAAALSTLELNRRRARLGAANAVDVLRAEQEVATSRSQVIQADENLRRAREALGLALGYPEGWGVTPAISLDQLRADARATCTQGESIARRPDIRAIRIGQKIAERNLEAVKYSYLPRIEATSVVSYNSNQQSTATREHYTWTMGGLITWDLYDGGMRYGERTSNEGLLRATRQDVVDAERNAKLQVTQAYRGVEVAQRSLEVAEKTREITADNARLSRIKFVNGTGTSFDMVQTQSAARQAELDVTVQQFELLQAQIAAFLALASCDI